MEPVADVLSTQLENLERERRRLEELLMLDASWRRLREFDAAGASDEIARAGLLDELKYNRIYAARCKLIETIELLSTAGAVTQGAVPSQTIADRIVLIDGAVEGQFRTRVRAKPKPRPPAAAEPAREGDAPVAVSPSQSEPSPPMAAETATLPDALELIDGLSRPAVELLMEAGTTRFCEIASWSAADVGLWRQRLTGLAQGTPGSWIEQAALLAGGNRTRYADRARRGEFAALVAMPDPLPEPVPVSRPRAVAVQTITPGAPIPMPDAGRAAPPAEVVSTPVATARRLPGGYARPNPGLPHRAPAAEEFAAKEFEAEAEIEVIAMTQAPSGAAPLRPRPQRLLRRLKAVLETDRFEADNYAAYRGVVQEASVTIVRPGGEVRQPSEKALPARPPTPRSRFLKALTGGT